MGFFPPDIDLYSDDPEKRRAAIERTLRKMRRMNIMAGVVLGSAFVGFAVIAILVTLRVMLR